MFAEECRKVARDYPDVKFEEAMIDTISMKRLKDELALNRLHLGKLFEKVHEYLLN